MSMFLCAECDNMKDSDDGCEEAKGCHFGLICVDCVDELRVEEEDAEDRIRAISVGGKLNGGSAA